MSSDSSDSSDDDQAELVTKSSGKKAVSKPADVVKDKKSDVIKEKRVIPEPAVEKSKVKKGKKSSLESVQKTEDTQVLEKGVAVAPVNKRKADDGEDDAGHVDKKANIDGIAVATARDNDLSKSARKRKQESATKNTVRLLTHAPRGKNIMDILV